MNESNAFYYEDEAGDSIYILAFSDGEICIAGGIEGAVLLNAETVGSLIEWLQEVKERRNA